MREVSGDIWGYHDSSWIVITTNGFVKHNGECVMGRGLALEAKTKYPKLPLALGLKIQQSCNRVFAIPDYRLFTFPVKHNWWEKANPLLIERSLQELVAIATLMNNTAGQNFLFPVYLTHVGCNNGGLLWTDVKPLMQRYLDDRFIICDKQVV